MKSIWKSAFPPFGLCCHRGRLLCMHVVVPTLPHILYFHCTCYLLCPDGGGEREEEEGRWRYAPPLSLAFYFLSVFGAPPLFLLFLPPFGSPSLPPPSGENAPQLRTRHVRTDRATAQIECENAGNVNFPPPPFCPRALLQCAVGLLCAELGESKATPIFLE